MESKPNFAERMREKVNQQRLNNVIDRIEELTENPMNRRYDIIVSNLVSENIAKLRDMGLTVKHGVKDTKGNRSFTISW